MKKQLLVGSLLTLLLTASMAAATKEERPSVPVKGTEGPDIRMTLPASYPQPAPEVEGPAIG